MLVQLSLTFLISLLQASAFPLVPRQAHRSIPIHRHVNPSQVGLCEGDQARASGLLAGANADLNLGKTIYSTISPVGCGSPPQNQNLVLDIISPDTLVGFNPNHPYTPPTSQSHNTTSINLLGLGKLTVSEVLDTIRIGDITSIPNQSVKCPLHQDTPSDTVLDGIIGLGSGEQSLVKNAFNQGVISDLLISLAFVPRSRQDEIGPEIVLGGIDSHHYTGEITHAPLTFIEELGLNVFGHSLTFAGIPLGTSIAGLVDTRSTLTLVSHEIFLAYVSATGAVLDSHTGLLTLTQEKFNVLQDLVLVLNGVPFVLNANSQILPTNSVKEFGGVPGVIYLALGNLGAASGHGVDVVYGITFLERFLVVLNYARNTIGLANTPHTSCGCN